jgi:serine/threonine-protein kinase
MEVTYAELSSPGPVRPKNEDFVGFWMPSDAKEKRERGIIAVLADGVGGLGKGEVASRLAVETVLNKFREAKPSETPQSILNQVFYAANLAVYDKGMENHGRSRMATTLAAVVLRGNKITVGNIGDSRVYLVRSGSIKQISTDHSYVAMQRKLGIITEDESRRSEHRSVLTRSVGHDPVVRTDIDEEVLTKGDRVVLCSDGLYGFIKDTDICNIVSRCTPAQACRQLVALAEQCGTDDNVSTQVLQIDEVDEVTYYRGVATYHESLSDPGPSGDLRPGDTLDGRFFITEILSRSGMATVYKATDQTNKQNVAVKVPYMQFESDPGFSHRFQREEEIGSRLNHPYILKFFHMEKKSRPYIVTEYLRGYTLAHLLHNVRPLPQRDALRIASRIAESLIYMHSQGVVHRDLKPQNVMICYDGNIRIMDFGIAKASQGRRITFTGFTPAMGTPDYMAPEQVKGKRGDERTDIYSLGALLYEMLSGHTPFEDENPFVVMNMRLSGDPVAPRKWNPEISPQVEEIILHAMERDPQKRYPSAAAMKADLDKPDQVEVTGRSERLQAPSKGKPNWRWLRVAGLSLLVPVVIVLLFLLLVWQTPHHR